MLIKGKGLFPAKGHEWEFVTHVDHNESSLRGHNVEPRVLSPFFSLSLSSYLPSRIRGVHEQRNEISSLASIVVETDPLRSRNGSCYPLWGDSVHLSRSELIIRKYYFCIIDAAGQMSISGREKGERKEEKSGEKNCFPEGRVGKGKVSSYHSWIHLVRTRYESWIDFFEDRTIELDSIVNYIIHRLGIN